MPTVDDDGPFEPLAQALGAPDDARDEGAALDGPVSGDDKEDAREDGSDGPRGMMRTLSSGSSSSESSAVVNEKEDEGDIAADAAGGKDDVGRGSGVR